jgi:hypothetical protein
MINLGFVVRLASRGEDGAEREYEVRRRARLPVREGFNVEAVLAPAWAGDTDYALGAQVANGGQAYTCRQAGRSASSPGPSGTGTAIADNTCLWDWAGPAVSTFPAVGSLQPLEGRQVDVLPELLREREVKVFLTPTKLVTGTEPGGDWEADRVVVEGEEWEVHGVKDWATLGGYYEALVVRPGR